jgi:hypothetical protein
MDVSESPDRPGDISPTGDAGVDPEKDDEKVVRKRTKTGCQTCRSRRIKCDEGKPECNNCVKSKRQCEGLFAWEQLMIGYGVRSARDALGGDMKRTKRYTPYTDRDGKGSNPAGPRSPKRKRQEETPQKSYTLYSSTYFVTSLI